MEDLLKNNKTCPEESIYQIGTMGESVSPDTLFSIVNEFYQEFERRFGSHIHILDWALHLDEGTPHIHERHVFDCENRYGELCPQQEKALEELGIPLPNPEKPKGRNNNRKQTFDAVCRTILFDIARRHGLHLDQEPSYGGRDYLEKQDYILMKQKEQLAAQEQKLEELTLKIEDVETLLDDVSDAAYDKAVEVVTDTVRQETHKEDIRLVEESKKWVLSPERKAPKKEREYAAERLDGVITKIKNAMQHALAKIQRTLMQPEVKQAGKEQVKKKAKESIMDILAKAKINADRDNRERWEREGRIAPTKKNDIESVSYTHLLQSIEVTDQNIGSFNRIARKYGIDCAPFKVKGEKRYMVFFKAPDADAMTAAFKEYTAKQVRKAERPSVLEKLQHFKSVSYTHLDVYKRQRQIGRVIDPAYLPQDFLQIPFRGLVFCHALCYTLVMFL